MTTKQTINGLDRETLSIALGFTCHGHKNRTDQAADMQHARNKLRAQLDAQSIGCSNGILCQNSKCGECGGNGTYKPVAQPQGEQVACMPVERCYDVRAKMIIAFNEAKMAGGDLDDQLDAAYKSALRYSPNPLNAEQPAPAAVVMSFDFEHPSSKERRTVALQKHDVFNGMEDYFYEKLGEQICQCESVGETNVVDCNCDEYVHDFEIVQACLNGVRP